MTRAEMKPIYVEAAVRARTKPQRSEEDVWFKQLEYASPLDVRTAVAAWFGTSAWMPKESEIKALTEQAQNKRMLGASSQKVLARWQCRSCGAYRCGFIESDDHEHRYCRGIPTRSATHGGQCGGDMDETFRELYASPKEQRHEHDKQRGSANGGRA